MVKKQFLKKNGKKQLFLINLPIFLLKIKCIFFYLFIKWTRVKKGE